MQSPMQFRAIQVRLAPSANDTVTVYPSPTHTRTIACENTAILERNACMRRDLQLDSRLSRPAMRVPLLRGRRMRDDLRLLVE